MLELEPLFSNPMHIVIISTRTMVHLLESELIPKC